jgi:hypothetical protein
MAITTRSKFTYGHNITENNQYINFTENGIDELSATIEVGSYSFSEFGDAVAVAMNAIGDNEYTTTVDLLTQKITISSDASFDLLVTNGQQISISAFPLIGFTSNVSGLMSYEGDSVSGLAYLPQRILKDYVPFGHKVSSIQSKVNESSSGDEIEIVTYGEKLTSSFNIKHITDLTGQNENVIENNPTAVQDTLDFMNYITKKRKIEFYPDRSGVEFTKCIVESTKGDSKGTGFELRELYTEKLANYYETGKIVLRKIN